jgi:Kelch motif/Galactose oxidase, central domain
MGTVSTRLGLVSSMLIAACAADAGTDSLVSNGPDSVVPMRDVSAVARLIRQGRQRPVRRAPGGYRVEPVSSRFAGATLPFAANEPIRMATTGGGELLIRRWGAKPAAAREQEGMLVYEDAIAGADALVLPTRRGVEDLLIVHEPDAVLGYEVALPSSWRLHAPEGLDGLVEVRDGRGTSRLRMWARGAWDAEGYSVPFSVQVEGDTIRLVLGEARSWPVALDPEWLGTDTMVVPRRLPRLTKLTDGRVLLSGGEESPVGSCELYEPLTGTFSAAGTMLRPRTTHTATLLATGEVLLVGGGNQVAGEAYADAELYDPETGQFEPAGDMQAPRYFHTATRLPSGKVLVAGDASGNITLELFDPVTRSFSTSSSMSSPRMAHTATLLPSGRVLLAGGVTEYEVPLASADVFDPDTGSITTREMGAPRFAHSATVLPSGNVLLAGGCVEVDQMAPAATCESPTGSLQVYEEASGFSSVGSLAAPRAWHGATLLPSGSVVFVGGLANLEEPLSRVEAFDPLTLGVEEVLPLFEARYAAGVTLLPTGKVLAAGGLDVDGATVDSAELWTSSGGDTRSHTLHETRHSHSATLMKPSGKVLISGGVTVSGATHGEVFDPSTNSFTLTGPMQKLHLRSTASALPNGEVLVAGGQNAAQQALSSTEIYDPETNAFRSGPSMSTPRIHHLAAELPDGRILIHGGSIDGTDYPLSLLTDAEIFDPASGEFSEAEKATYWRYGGESTPLADGRVLVTGGGSSRAEVFHPATNAFVVVDQMPSLGYHSCTLLKAEDVLCVGMPVPTCSSALFDPGTETFSCGPDSTLLRSLQSAVRLDDDRVLLMGGWNHGTKYVIAEAETYDPVSDTFHATDSLTYERVDHTATKLLDGRVLVVGGKNSVGATPDDVVDVVYDNAEIYDPQTNTFSLLGSVFDANAEVAGAFSATLLPSGELLLVGSSGNEIHDLSSGTRRTSSAIRLRQGHTASLLRTGSVLLAGGEDDAPITQAEVYDPIDDSSAIVAMSARIDHTATTLPNGSVLLVGGHDGELPLADVSRFDPQIEQVDSVGSLAVARSQHGAALLPSGRVVVAGGVDGQGLPLSSVEVFDPMTELSENLGDETGPGPTHALAMADGGVLLAGDGWSCRFSEPSGTCAPIPGAVDHAFSLTGTLFGTDVLCGDAKCLLLDSGTNKLRDAVHIAYTVAETEAAATTSLGGDLVVVSPVDGVHIEPLSTSLAIRPTIDAAGTTTSLVSGQSATVRGQRFMRSSAVESDGSVRVETVPLVAFAPANGGPAAYGRVTKWNDTELEWIPRDTVHRGAGWLHVIVDAVPSEAVFAVLEASPSGRSCSYDLDCASGFCIESVCCERRCSGSCESCLAERQGQGGQDGVCAPILVDTDPKDACTTEDPASCGQTGACDGKGACARYPEGHDCGEGVCRSGVCRWCEGDALVGEDIAIDCAPYACENAVCLSSCESALQCAEAHVCGVEGKCEPYVSHDVPTDPGACSMSARRRAGASEALLALLLALGLGRRRSRAHGEGGGSAARRS